VRSYGTITDDPVENCDCIDGFITPRLVLLVIFIWRKALRGCGCGHGFSTSRCDGFELLGLEEQRTDKILEQICGYELLGLELLFVVGEDGRSECKNRWGRPGV